MSSSKVEFKLIGFKEDPDTPNTGGGDVEFTVKINPERIKQNGGLLFNTDNRANGSLDVKQWKGYKEETLEATITLDGSGYTSSDASTVTPVEQQIEDLNKTIYDYDGGVHKPLYVVVNYNDITFLGHIKDLEFENKVFGSNGKIILADVKLLFTRHINSKTAALKQNRNSPDMSHLKVIREGDKIPLICDEIYDDPTYYIQIAELNGLTNFRNVRTGKNLLFPPLINE